MLDDQFGSRRDLQIAAVGRGRGVALSNESLRVRAILVPRRDAEAGVFIVQRTAGELFNASGVNAVVLPVPVSADDREMTDLILLQPGEEGIRFVAKAAEIGVIVDLL